MVCVSLTRINAGSNLFFILPGVLPLSLSYEEVGGRFFLPGGNPLPGYGVPRRKGRNPAEKQPNRLHSPPPEHIDLQELFTHTANASAIQSVTGSKLLLLTLNVINVIAGDQNPLVETLCRATRPFLLVVAVTCDVERYLPIVSNREGIV